FFIIFSIAVQTPGSGTSNLLAVRTTFTGSGNLYCQWELSPGSGNAFTMASAIICLSINQKFNFSKYIFESMVKNLDNVNKFLMYPRLRKTKRKDTELPHTSVPISVVDEAVNEEMDDSLERVATIATSLDAEQDRGNISKTQSKVTPNEPGSQRNSLGGGPRCQKTIRDTAAQTRSERVSKISNDPLLAGVNTPRSGEDSLKLTELIELYTKLQQRVLDLETIKTTQAMEIESLKRRVKKLERRKRLRTHGLKRLYKGRIADIDANEDITLVSTHDEKMFDVDQDLGDYQLAERLQAKKQQELNDEEKAKLFMQVLEKRRKFFAAKIAEEKRNKPPTQAQQRKNVYLPQEYGRKEAHRFEEQVF
nr:hypothetical protein [Tanacetum cinerariifolium]